MHILRSTNLLKGHKTGLFEGKMGHFFQKCLVLDAHSEIHKLINSISNIEELSQ
jgi:hypothetical protein